MAEPFLNPPQGETGLRAARPEDYVNNPEPSPDAFGRFLQAIQRAQTGPPGFSSGVVTGPGRNILQQYIPTRLFDYLDKSPFKFRATTEWPSPKAYNKSSGTFFSHPNDPDKLGTIYLNTDYLRTPTPTHEALHAANYLTKTNRLISEGMQPGQASTEARIGGAGLMDRATERLRPMPNSNTTAQRWVTPAKMVFEKADADPRMAGYLEHYKKWAGPTFPAERLELETVNEWQALNANAKQGIPHQENRLDQLLRLMPWGGAGALAAQNLGGDTSPK